MTPELPARLAFPSLEASGRWRERTLGEPVTVFIEAREVVVRLEATGEELAVALAAITGASWRAGVLSLHRDQDELQLRGGDALDRAWHALSKRACVVPEVARALRALGGARGERNERDERGVLGDRGGLDAARVRFFAPLMQARRRLEGEEPIDWLVAGFDATTLADRMRGTLGAIAAERHPSSPAHRRALEARLVDACEPLFEALDHVAAAARALQAGEEPQRFVRWREWASQVRALFASADRSWRVMSAVLSGDDRALPPPHRR